MIMQLTNEQINTFQSMYLRKFGIEITKAEALEKGLRLLCLVEIVLKEKVKILREKGLQKDTTIKN